MKHMMIDGIKCEFDAERNVLEVALRNHIDIPNLCYCEKLSVYGGCRLCIVETDKGVIDAACSLLPQEGMAIRTNTPRLRKNRQMILEMLLASHRAECTTCEKSGRCKLQAYAKRYGIKKVRFANTYSKAPVDNSSPAVIRDPSKCVLCGNCVRMCAEIQGIRAIDFAGHGSSTRVSGGLGRRLSETDCVSCGLCATVCPTGALVVKNEVSELWKAIFDSGKKVAALISPAVGDTGKLITALKTIGVDYAFDISAAADLAICEFADELKNADKRPLITASCPAAVKFIEKRHPELLPQLSTCASPMAMMAAVLRRFYGDEELYCCAIMPCTATKMESGRPELVKDDERLVDLVLTTSELEDIISEAGVELDRLAPSAPDAPFDTYSDAGRAFALTGDISDSLRLHTGDDALKVTVVSGLKNAEELISAGIPDSDVVVIRGCPEGCSDKPFGKPGEFKVPDDNPSMVNVESLIRFGRKNLLHIELQ